jgi:hypothetical protein
MYVSGYQSIDVLCIVLSVKFDGGPSISVLKNNQLYEKKWTSKVQNVQIFLICQTPTFEERTDLVKKEMLQTEPPGQNQSVHDEFCGQ